MNSQISQQEAAAAANRILGFYDTIPAADPKAFAAGLAATLMIFPREVIERAVDPVSGIPAKVGYLNLAAIRQKLDEWQSEYLQHLERTKPVVREIEAPRDPEADERMAEKFKQLAVRLASGLTEAKPKDLEAA